MIDHASRLMAHGSHVKTYMCGFLRDLLLACHSVYNIVAICPALRKERVTDRAIGGRLISPIIILQYSIAVLPMLFLSLAIAAGPIGTPFSGETLVQSTFTVC